MKKGKIIKRTILLLLIIVLAYLIRYCWYSFPIISGYGSKNLCSCMFVANRNEENVKQEELGDFPLSIGSYKVNYQDSSVTGSVFGMAKSKAIYRKGLGCTLVNELSEDEIRKQHFVTATQLLINTDSIAWPMGDKASDGIPAEINMQQLNKVVDASFQEKDPKYFQGTRAVIVLYDGKIIAEKYGTGYDRHSKMLGWSMSKSVTSALVGILVKQGKLNITSSAPVPEWNSAADNRHAITLENLLQQASGLKYEENYKRASEATNMLFRSGDMAAYTAALPLQDKPGSVFYYSSGNSNIISRIVRQTIGEKDYHAFPAKELFYKLGMYSAVMEPDASGTFVGSSYMYATARDWARFGLLYYYDGVFNGERILPEDWVKKTVTPLSSDPKKRYGYQFWLNGFGKDDNTNHKFPDVPTDLFYADGFGGQGVYIISSKKLIVVRLGLHNIDDNGLLRNVIKCIR